MKLFRRITLPAVFLATVALHAQVPAQQPAARSAKTRAQRYAELISGSEALKGSLFGVLAVNGAGDTLACIHPDTRMVPASNLKLVTTGAALHALGSGFRFETRIGVRGEVSAEGVLDGDLYIIGGGDPTLASKDTSALTRAALFARWEKLLDGAGIKSVRGRVIGDGRYFDGPIEKDTWSYQDIGTAYGTGGDGLCFYENSLEVKVSAGTAPGTPVNAIVSFPQLPWLRFANRSRTGGAGTGDELYLYTSDVWPFAEMRGTFAVDRAAKTEEFSNKYGAYTCAHYFCEYLRANGIPVSAGPADVRGGRLRADPASLENGPYAAKVDDLRILGATSSPQLKDIVLRTNHLSDNFYAETLLRMLGRRLHHSASYDSSYVALGEVLSALGADPAGVRIVDGSGLSRHNYVSPSYFVRFLGVMMDSPVFEDYVASLPQPGKGTLASRLRGEQEAVRARVRMKSGSMNGTLCFSGYIIPERGARDETVVFSILTNNALAGGSKVGPLLDRLIVLLAAENGN